MFWTDQETFTHTDTNTQTGVCLCVRDCPSTTLSSTQQLQKGYSPHHLLLLLLHLLGSDQQISSGATLLGRLAKEKPS